MLSRTRIRILAGAVGVAGCSPSPDVVVQGTLASTADAGTEASAFEDVPPPSEQCVPGDYKGLVQGEWASGDAGAPVAFNGPISFTLEKSLNGEFYEVTETEISGSSDVGFEFKATVHSGGRCQEGTFDIPLEGEFPIGSIDIKFTGRVSGHYVASGDSNGNTPIFYGGWSASEQADASVLGLAGGGTWVAALVAGQ